MVCELRVRVADLERRLHHPGRLHLGLAKADLLSSQDWWKIESAGRADDRNRAQEGYKPLKQVIMAAVEMNANVPSMSATVEWIKYQSYLGKVTGGFVRPWLTEVHRTSNVILRSRA